MNCFSYIKYVVFFPKCGPDIKIHTPLTVDKYFQNPIYFIIMCKMEIAPNYFINIEGQSSTLWGVLLSTWPHHKWPHWPKQMEACGRNWPRCPTNTGHTSKHTHSSVWSSIHHEAKTGQKTMGNEAWLILLALGHKQSVGNQRRRKHNPSGPTSCCMSWSGSPWWGKTLNSCTLDSQTHKRL